MSNNIDNTLAQRGERYGSFDGHAAITQDLKRVMQDGPNWDYLSDDQKESLEMVAHKIGRILNGDPNYHDSWHDIVGYAKLVADRLEEKQSDTGASLSTGSVGGDDLDDSIERAVGRTLQVNYQREVLPSNHWFSLKENVE